MRKNVVGWFEIPVSNMDRAVKFYEVVFQFQLHRHPMETIDMSWFPMVEDGMGAAGSLVYNEQFYAPSENGTLIYFTSPAGDVNVELARVEAAGGKIVLPKTEIGEGYGCMAVFMDTEGNRIALHSRS